MAHRHEHVADVDVEHGMEQLAPGLNFIMHMVGTDDREREIVAERRVTTSDQGPSAPTRSRA